MVGKHHTCRQPSGAICGHIGQPSTANKRKITHKEPEIQQIHVQIHMECCLQMNECLDGYFMYLQHFWVDHNYRQSYQWCLFLVHGCVDVWECTVYKVILF
eukprot:161144_1